jgi:hypothetical protein
MISGLAAFWQVAAASALTIAAADWRLVTQKSGPVNYYSVVTENGVTFLRSKYTPGLKTAVVGWQTPDADRHSVKRVRWSWRAQTLPKNGDECVPDRADSAAVVYVSFKRGLKYYSLKYVWSAVGTVGAVCDRKRNPFVAQDTIILESGGPTGTWKNVDIDIAAEYRKHFEGGDPKAEVPSFIGIGLMSDGDQTSSDSSADFGTFTLVR